MAQNAGNWEIRADTAVSYRSPHGRYSYPLEEARAATRHGAIALGGCGFQVRCPNGFAAPVNNGGRKEKSRQTRDV
jgi:hypothetical protein